MWHRRLDHPSLSIQNKLFSCYSLPTLKNTSIITNCDACLSNKSHRLPFDISSISCSKPFEIIYTDVWGPALIISFDKFRFYVIFVTTLPITHGYTLSTINMKFQQYFRTLEGWPRTSFSLQSKQFTLMAMVNIKTAHPVS